MEFLHDPTFWVAIAFVVFVVLVFKPGKKAISGALDDKIAQIRNEVEEAHRLREEAQAALAAYQRQQRDAAQEAEDLMNRAKAEAEAHRKQATAALQTLLQRQEAMAREKIAQAEAAAVAEVQRRAVEIAIAATAKLLEGRMSGAAGDQLIDDSIKALPNRLH
jgi:F-type H+-transporting ATPase subunit b